jgi:lipopolysaccharide transport system ATP-binding protein
MARDLDGVLVGGGFIVRFGKIVAPGYGPPTAAIHHPTGYWLTPALIALQHGIPLIWNAPSVDCNYIPGWADPLLQLAIAHSSYIAVRDQPSQAALARFVDKEPINLTPDTAFALPRLLDDRRPSVEFNRLREASGLSGQYIVVQATRGLNSFLGFVRKHSHRLRDYRFLALPIGPVLGDHEAILADDLPGMVRLPSWPHPLLLAEVISQAAAVVGESYHLAITALAFGVPVFCSADLTVGKHTALASFETIHPLPNETETDLVCFVEQLGKTAPTAAALAARDQLSRHWDRVAAEINKGRTNSQSAVGEFLQSLPTLLESTAAVRDAAVTTSATTGAELRRVLGSPSWRATAPARFVMRNLKRLINKK